MPTRILITGGCGFVGRHLAKRLSAEAGAEVTIVDALTTGLRQESWPEHLRCDVHELVYADCVNYFAASSDAFDVVFHLAAIVEGRMAIEHNPLRVAKDLMIDAALFDWAVRTKPKKIVYFSSSACYPIGLQTRGHNVALVESEVDFTEGRIDLPDMSYGWAKLTGEFLSHLAVTRHGLDVAVYRPFSGYGEDQALTYPFPSIVKRVLESNGGPIEVWGSGEQSRDFIYIEDCITAVLETYETLRAAEPLNLGSGVRTTFRELIELACTVLGKGQPGIMPLLDRPEGVFARYCDASKQQALGLLPTVSLEEGIRIVADFAANTGGSLVG
jgi:GDP-L-fucose synthase